jgi:hypothetical protein
MQFLGSNQAADLVMKSVLAGAASVHLSVSSLKFRDLIERRDSIADMVASISNYQLTKGDRVYVVGAGLPVAIQSHRRWTLFAVLGALLVTGVLYGYKAIS